MSTKYFHYCRASKQGFRTIEEWSAYADAHEHPCVVAEYNGFQYNVNDHCLNPHIKYLTVPGMLKCEIRTAESEGGWSFGYDYAYHLGSACGGPGYRLKGERDVYPTERAAIEAALRHAIKFCEYHNVGSSSINAIKNEIQNTRQLNLFD